jgi:anti-anti-sigma factor
MLMLVMAQWDKELLILRLSGRFDKTARVPVETALAEIESRFCRHVIFDFSKVSSLDSAGIGKLLLLYYALRKKNVALSVMNPRASVEEILHVVNLASVIPITQRKTPVRSVA